MKPITWVGILLIVLGVWVSLWRSQLPYPAVRQKSNLDREFLSSQIQRVFHV
jgi:hypothetical protein